MPRTARRPGFTLIELLLVIAIIGILAAATMPMAMSAINSQRKARATGAIKAIGAACDAYRKLYGDFPLARAGTSPYPMGSDLPAFRQDLFAQLNGTKVLYTTTNAAGLPSVELVNHNDSRLVNASKRVVRPILDERAVPACDASGNENVDPSAKTEFVDPWGNAYDYRYRVACAAGAASVGTGGATALGGYSHWMSPEYLVVSCGPDFVESADSGKPHVPDMEEYWHVSKPDPAPSADANMGARGVVSSVYFENGEGYSRADNITSWSGR